MEEGVLWRRAWKWSWMESEYLMWWTNHGSVAFLTTTMGPPKKRKFSDLTAEQTSRVREIAATNVTNLTLTTTMRTWKTSIASSIKWQIRDVIDCRFLPSIFLLSAKWALSFNRWNGVPNGGWEVWRCDITWSLDGRGQEEENSRRSQICVAWCVFFSLFLENCTSCPSQKQAVVSYSVPSWCMLPQTSRQRLPVWCLRGDLVCATAAGPSI